MSADTADERPEIEALLARAAGGDSSAAAELVECHRERLKRMVEARIDPRLRQRIDASDVLQEVSLEVVQRLPRYAEERPMPVFLWLRYLTAQRLGKLRRSHLETHQRDLRRENEAISDLAASSSDCLAAHLVSVQTSPSEVAARNELRSLLERALEQLASEDREVISLRHLEQLSNVEVSRELGLDTSAASKRYLRAMQRFRDLIGGAVDPGAPVP